jgi:hypothetical protein
VRTDWTATYDPGGQSFVAGATPEGDGYLTAGTTLGGDEDQPWLLPVGADGTVGEPLLLADFAGFALDVVTVDGRRLVAGDETGVGVAARPWVAAYDGTESAWAYEPSFEDGADRRVATLLPFGDGVALVGSRAPSLGGSGTRHGFVTRLTPDGTVGDRTVVGGGEGGLDAALSVEDAVPTGDGGLFLAGRAGERSDRAAWVGAVDADGLRWGRRIETVDGTGTGAATACDALDDDYLVGVFTTPDATTADPHVLRVGPEGEPRWTRRLPGSGGPDAFAVTDSGVVTGGAAPLQDASVEFYLGWLTTDGQRRHTQTATSEGGVNAALAAGDAVVVGGNRDSAADLRQLSLADADPGGSESDGGDSNGSGSDDGDSDGDPDGDGGGLPLPGFGPGVALAGGALGLGAWLRRRGR